MANDVTTYIDKPISGLKVTGYPWGRIYRGTKEALISARLVKQEWFPGPGTAKNATRIAIVDGEMKVLPFGKMATREQEEKGVIKIFKANKREFEAYISFTEEERDRQLLKQEIERQHAEKKKALDEAPESRADFSKDRSRTIRNFMEVVHNLFRRADNGFHYAPDVVEEAQDLIADLISLAANGRVCFDKKRQERFLEEVEEKATKAHPEFSAFMKATLAIGKAAI